MDHMGMAHMIWVELFDYLALYEIHNLSNCPDNPTKLIDKFCDIWYFIMTFAFLLILVVLAVSCYYCTHRIDLNNLNREWGVLITNCMIYDIVWYDMVHMILYGPYLMKLIRFKLFDRNTLKLDPISKYWESCKRKSSYNDRRIESIWTRKKTP